MSKKKKKRPCCGRLWSGAVSQAWLTFHSGASQDHQRAPNSSYYSASTVAWRETGRPLSCEDTETAHYVTAQREPTVSHRLQREKRDTSRSSLSSLQHSYIHLRHGTSAVCCSETLDRLQQRSKTDALFTPGSFLDLILVNKLTTLKSSLLFFFFFVRELR